MNQGSEAPGPAKGVSQRSSIVMNDNTSGRWLTEPSRCESIPGQRRERGFVVATVLLEVEIEKDS